MNFLMLQRALCKLPYRINLKERRPPLYRIRFKSFLRNQEDFAEKQSLFFFIKVRPSGYEPDGRITCFKTERVLWTMKRGWKGAVVKIACRPKTQKQFWVPQPVVVDRGPALCNQWKTDIHRVSVIFSFWKSLYSNNYSGYRCGEQGLFICFRYLDGAQPTTLLNTRLK